MTARDDLRSAGFTPIPSALSLSEVARLDAALDRVYAEPAGATHIVAVPGDALVFDRRLWHSRSPNHSAITRKAIFLAYTFRWIRPRDDLSIDPRDSRLFGLSAVRRQLLGVEAGAAGGPHSHWGLGDSPAPLRAELARSGVLNQSIPSHR
jgi:ectoine hydroxylase-related dioxygenase (phytanoyl-CoA dioxygenase family)